MEHWDIEQALAFGKLLSEPEKKWEGFPKMKNNLTDQDINSLENSYTYHAPKEDQAERYAELRDTARRLATIVLVNCPHSRERSLAITKIEEAVMWANKSIACNE